MGNTQAKLYQKLWQCFPNPDNSSSWFDKNSKPFANTEDKQQFIYATITVLSQNGAINLESHEVRLLYSRRDNDRVVARVVAEQEGVVKAQVAARDGGKDQNEAFKALRNHVERTLDEILKDVPGASYNGDKVDKGGPSSGRCSTTRESGVASPTSPRRMNGESVQRPQGQGLSGMPIDAPPAYGKAVKDWRSGNDEK